MSGRRSEIDIKADMLKAVYDSGVDGINLTNIMQKANISSALFASHIDNLISKGLIVKSQKSKNRTIYTITFAGVRIYHLYQQVFDTLGNHK